MLVATAKPGRAKAVIENFRKLFGEWLREPTIKQKVRYIFIRENCVITGSRQTDNLGDGKRLAIGKASQS